jgi:hypothetical protein
MDSMSILFQGIGWCSVYSPKRKTNHDACFIPHCWIHYRWILGGHGPFPRSKCAISSSIVVFTVMQLCTLSLHTLIPAGCYLLKMSYVMFPLYEAYFIAMNCLPNVFSRMTCTSIPTSLGFGTKMVIG